MSAYDVIDVQPIMPVVQLVDTQAAQVRLAGAREMVLAMSHAIQCQYVEACLWDIVQAQIHEFKLLHQVGAVYLIQFALDADPVVPFLLPQLVQQAVRPAYVQAMSQLIHLLVVINRSRRQPTDEHRQQLAHLVQVLTPMIAYTAESSPEALAFWYSQLRLTASDPQRFAPRFASY